MEFLSARVSVERGASGTSIVFSPRLPRWKETLLVVWFTAWTCCGVYVAVELAHMPSSPQRAYVLAFMAFWLYFFLATGRTMLWRVKGFELMRVKDGAMTLKQSILGFGKAREHFMENVTRLAAIEMDERSWKWQLGQSFWVMGVERIGFEHFGRRVAFGRGMTAEEARAVTAELKRALAKSRKAG